MALLSVRALLAPAALALAACSFGPAVGPEPAYRHVKLVGRVPPPKRYEYVGKVWGVAPREGFVEAAHDARVDIKTKAVKLGADVVKIDRVRLPSDRPRSADPVVMLVGRAYRPKQAGPAMAAATSPTAYR